MNIILGSGFDNIYFGMFRREVIAELGQPDKKYESDYNLHFQYFSLRCDFWFLKEDKRLHWIESSNPELKIFGRHILNKNKIEVLSFLNSKIDDRLEHEDYGNCEYHNFDRNCLSLHFEFDTLISVRFGHFWSENDEPIWVLPQDIIN